MILLSLAAFAAPTPLSLHDAQQLARVASENVLSAEADVRKADADRDAAFGGYLPSLTGAISYSHTFISEYDGLFDTASTDTATTTATTASPGAAAYSNPFADLPFGKPDTWRADFSLSQLVYGGGRVRAQNRMAKTAEGLASLSLQSTEAAIQLDVATAYYDAALMTHLLGIARESLAQAELTRTHASEAAKVGRQPEFEVVRAQVEVENQKVVVIQQARVVDLAMARLKQLVGLDDSAELELTTALDAELPAAPVPTSDERVAVRQFDAAVAVAEASVDLTRSSGLPTVAVSGTGGFVSYPDNPLPPLEDWRTNLSAGASVSMPLFSGGVIRAQIRSAEAELEKAKAQRTQLAELAALDTRDARSAYDAARAQLDATQGTVALATRTYQIGEVRFKEGISTQAELADARLLLQRAQANRAQALRDVQLAALRLQLLTDLPLQSR